METYLKEGKKYNIIPFAITNTGGVSWKASGKLCFAFLGHMSDCGCATYCDSGVLHLYWNTVVNWWELQTVFLVKQLINSNS